jgi:hypothetical protein
MAGRGAGKPDVDWVVAIGCLVEPVCAVEAIEISNSKMNRRVNFTRYFLMQTKVLHSTDHA